MDKELKKLQDRHRQIKKDCKEMILRKIAEQKKIK